MQKFYKYSRNVTTIKKYGNNFIRIQTMNVQRTPFTSSDIEDFERLDKLFTKATKNYIYGCDINTTPEYINQQISNRNDNRLHLNKSLDSIIRLEESIIRSRRMVFEYAMSNEWQFFCTFTIDSKKFDRYSLDVYHKAFSHWLRDYFRRKLGYDVQYILIPEQHKDGAWHEHGLFFNFPFSELKEFQLSDGKLPPYILKKIRKGEKIYNCPAYAKKFGFCTFEPVRSSEACAKYITKYITKDIARSSHDKGHKLYYVSRKLKKAENIAIGKYKGVPFYDYENDYGAYATFAYSDDFAKILEDKIEKM